MNPVRRATIYLVCSIMICGFLLLTQNGCTLLARSTYGVAVDERKVGTIATDERTKLAIRESLLEDDAIRILDISAYCYGGHVYLVGEYGSEEEKERALEIAHRAPGVKPVTQYLLRKKRDDNCGRKDDLAIVGRIRARLIGNEDVSSTNIDVKTVQCRVVLLGIVGSKREIADAITEAKGVSGVREVVSFLRTTK